MFRALCNCAVRVISYLFEYVLKWHNWLRPTSFMQELGSGFESPWIKQNTSLSNSGQKGGKSNFESCPPLSGMTVNTIVGGGSRAKTCPSPSFDARSLKAGNTSFFKRFITVSFIKPCRRSRVDFPRSRHSTQNTKYLNRIYLSMFFYMKKSLPKNFHLVIIAHLRSMYIVYP